MDRRRPGTVTRRRALAALASGSASLAGCSTPLSSATGRTLVDRGTRWAPDYESVSTSGIQAGFLAVDTDQFLPPLSESLREHLDGQWGGSFLLDRSMSDVDRYVTDVREWGRVYHGLDGIDDVLESNGFEHEETYEGFDVYVSPGGSGSTVAVDGTTVLAALFPENAEVMLDVAHGDRPGAVESRRPFSRLVEVTEARQYVRAFSHRPGDSGLTPGFEGQVGRSDAVSVDDEQFDLRTVLLFEDAGQVDVDAVRSEVSGGVGEGVPFVHGLSSFEVSAEDRHVAITGSGPTRQLYVGTGWNE